MKIIINQINQENSPSYLTTGPDTGAPLPAYVEEYTFPKYISDTTRMESLAGLIPELVTVIVARSADEDPQEVFDDVVISSGNFGEVRRKVWQQLPEYLLEKIQY